MSTDQNLSASLDTLDLDVETAVPPEAAEYSLDEILAEFGGRSVQRRREEAEIELEALKPQPVVVLTEQERYSTPEEVQSETAQKAQSEDIETVSDAVPVWNESPLEENHAPEESHAPEEQPALEGEEIAEQAPEAEQTIEEEPVPEAEAEREPEGETETEVMPEGEAETEVMPEGEAETEPEAEEQTEPETMPEAETEEKTETESEPDGEEKTKVLPTLEPVKIFLSETLQDTDAADVEWRTPENAAGIFQSIDRLTENLREKCRNIFQSVKEKFPRVSQKPQVSESARVSETDADTVDADTVDADTVPDETETEAPQSPPVPIQVEEIVENTVDAVMAERYQVSWSPRAFFSQQDTDTLYASESEEKEPLYVASEEAELPEINGPNLKTAANVAKAEYRKRIRDLPAALLSALPPTLFLFSEWTGLRVVLLYDNGVLRAFLMLICLIASIWFCRQAFTAGRRCTSAFLCGLCAVAASADCVIRMFAAARSPADSYGAVACLALIFAKWGVSLESRGQFDALRTAAIDKTPPYLVTATENGARKQRGAVPGFYTFASAQNFSSRWQTLLLPLVLAASLVFAALSSAGQDRPWDFFLNWSAILCAGATFTLPLCWGLPWARLARRLNNAGCAVAGWDGAEHISQSKNMIVTDQDLFPPGSIQINGMKIYNEDVEKVSSYAASMAHASGCGLQRVFDDLLRSELGHYLPVADFQFYQEGGFSGIIGGESVLFGTESFLLKMGLHLPEHPRFHTGIFLAIEGELTAVFAVHYQAAENVDFALRLMRRGNITAILAARDPNITPKLLQRKFHRKLKVEFPSLASRVALSETSKKRHLPRALLFREGLLPYAEAVVGSRRLCRGVRRATILSLFGSAAGTVLAFYLVFEGRYNLLTPLTLILFLLLWTVPALLTMELT